MKKLTSLISLVLVILMLASLLAGCSGSTKPAETPAEPETEATTQAPEAASPETEAPEAESPETEAPAEETEAEPEVKEIPKPDTSVCWRSEEPETLSIFWAWPSIISKFFPDATDLPNFRSIEKLTNVKMEMYVVADDVASEKRNLLIAAGDLPDICPNLCQNYTGGTEQAVADEVALDIAPYLEEYCPNYYYYIMQAFPDIYDQTVSKSGYLGGFAGIFNQDQRSDQGNWIRQDWLDKLGLDMPETPDQFYDVLTAFKAEYNCTDTYCLMPSFGGDFISNAFTHLDLYREGNKAVYGIMDDDRAKEYLQYLAKLYADGLVGTDFTSYVENTVHDGVVESNNCGVFQQDVSYITNYSRTVDDPNFHAVAIPALVSEPGVKTGFARQQQLTQGETCIAYTTDKMELALRWCDTLYSDPVSAVANYGEEGVTYTRDENGKVQYTELVTANPDGMPQPLVLGVYGFGAGSMGFLIDLEQKYIDFTEDQYASHDIWKTSYDGDYNNMPTDLSDYFSIEEQSTLASLRTDIETAQEEIYFKLIIGEASFDDWDTYVEQIRSVGAGEYQRMYQEKLDQYIADHPNFE